MSLFNTPFHVLKARVGILVYETKSFKNLGILSIAFRRLWIKGSQVGLVFAIAFLLIEGALATIMPNAFRYLVDTFIQAKQLGWEKPLAHPIPLIPPGMRYDDAIGWLIIASATLLVLTYAAFNTGTGLGRNSTYKSQVTWATDLFAFIVRLPMSYHVRTRKADILKNVEQTVREVQDFIYNGFFVGFLRTVILMLFIFVVTFLTAPKMFFECFAVFAADTYLLFIFGSYVNRLEKKNWKLVSESQAKCLETMRNIRETKLACNEEVEIEERRQLAAQQLAELKKTALKWRQVTTLFNFLQASGYLWVMFSVLKPYVKSNLLTVGDCARLILFWGMLFAGLVQLMFLYLKIQGLHPKLVELQKVMQEQQSIASRPGAARFLGFHRELVFRDVDLAYCEKNGQPLYVLKGINFAVPKGKVTALAGKTGCGKSTLFYLLARLYEPTKGCITADGVDIRDFELTSYRRAFTALTQQASTWRKPAAANIAYYRMEASAGQIVEAAKIAKAHGFISRMPQGYDSIIEDGAANISGGERQRLALARAVLARDAEIVVLDEPTTGLDAQTSGEFMEELLDVFDGKTIVLITHDHNILGLADRVVFIAQTRVQAIGSHQALIESCDQYRRLVTYVPQARRNKH